MKRKAGAIEPLATVLRREAGLVVPPTVDAPPMAMRDWEAAVGTRIAARARPICIERGVLLVRAASATWAQELSLLSAAIVSSLRGLGFPVDALRFRVGPVDPPERPPTRTEVRREPPEMPLPQDLRSELARVDDAELREAIARAAAKNLGWQASHVTKPGRAGKSATESKATTPTSAQRAAPTPRSAAAKTARPDQTSTPSSGARRRRP